MAKEASVAPKERVNIVYKPATGNQQAEIELPFRVLVMGDFTLRTEDAMLEEREVVDIDKDNFNQVMGEHKLGLELGVANKLQDGASEDEQLAVKLSFETLKDFEPEQIARNVPELSKLLELREALVALKSPLGNNKKFRDKIQKLLDDPSQRESILKELGLGGEGGGGGETPPSEGGSES
jgi:type VI secretion system protein ImpB